ncbi:hypothetical protein LIA77_11946 [Sarocladium implicatum]|nr:hypothetical protein LIA77_11946 [Sarocladium implicatum]
MIAYTTLFFAGIAAAMTGAAHPEGIYQRMALKSMTLNDADQICASNQALVCCSGNGNGVDNDGDCAPVEFNDSDRSDFLYEHCKSIVVCCEFTEKNTIHWGDVQNECIYAGNVA